MDTLSPMVRLAILIGARSMVDPAALPGRASKRVQVLLKRFMRVLSDAEQPESTATDLARAELLALGLALRVLLNPDATVQRIVDEECQRDYGNDNKLWTDADEQSRAHVLKKARLRRNGRAA